MRSRTRGGVVVWAFLLLLCFTPLKASGERTQVSRPAQRVDTLAAATAADEEAAAGKDLLSGPQVWEDDEFVEAPKQVVATLIRAALNSPENQAAWAELARALPELSEEGDSFSYGIARAARVADSVAIAAATAASGSGAGPKGTTGWVAFTESADRVLRSTVDQVVLWVTRHDGLIITALGTLLVALILGKGRDPLSLGRTQKEEEQTVAGEYALKEETSKGMDAARALWSSGLPVNEISRRTGLAQDALSVMVSLQRSART
jgi:hypothetical protein